MNKKTTEKEVISIKNEQIVEVVTGLTMLSGLNKFTIFETNVKIACILLVLFPFKEAYDNTIRSIIEKYKPTLTEGGEGQTVFNFNSPEDKVLYLKEVDVINKKQITINSSRIMLSSIKNDSPEMAKILILINPILDKYK